MLSISYFLYYIFLIFYYVSPFLSQRIFYVKRFRSLVLLFKPAPLYGRARGVCVFFWTLYGCHDDIYSLYTISFLLFVNQWTGMICCLASHISVTIFTVTSYCWRLGLTEFDWFWHSLTQITLAALEVSGSLRDEGSGWHGTHGAGAGEAKMKTLLLPATAHTALRCTLCTGCLPGLYTRCVHIIKLSLSLDITCCYYWQQILPLGLDIRPTVDTAKPWITLTIKSSEQTTSVWNGCVGGTYHIRS